MDPFLPKELTDKIKTIAKQSKTEEDLKINVQRLLDIALENMGIKHKTEYEKIVYETKRADVIYPTVVIEYESPYSLRNKSKRNKSIIQLSGYLKAVNKDSNDKLVGVSLDGSQIIFVKTKKSNIIVNKPTIGQLNLQGEIISDNLDIQDIEIDGPHNISENTIEKLLIYLRQLNRKILSAENIAIDFGSESDIGCESVNLLYDILINSNNPKVNVLYGEWKRLFGIVYGEGLDKAVKDINKLSEYYKLRNTKIRLKPLLFTIHSYFALIMKMITAEILSIRHENLFKSFVDKWSICTHNELKYEFIDMENGGLFKRYGINNFLEGTFFSWYIEEWNDNIISIIRNISKKLSEYEPATPSLEPVETRDLLKKLYQYLIPKIIRHDLGEFYTPDWIADILISELEYDASPDKRVLDPACGSGTFLILVINKIIKNNKNKISDDELLMKILTNIVGFDINPIAVLSSRTNFLIAVSSLLQIGDKEIEIPVYMADSIMTPKMYSDLFKAEYTVPTTVGKFKIPKSLALKGTLDSILEVLEGIITIKGNHNTFLNRIEKIIGKEEFDVHKDNLLTLFNMINNLEKEKKDKIWTRIIKNSFAPLYLGKFDYIIGNPPWVNWQNLSEEYRKLTKHVFDVYNLLSWKAKVGAVKIDISILFVYVSLDKYLNDNGKLGFLIPQSVYQSQSARGFRNFILPDKSNIKVDKIHDFNKIKVFEDATNRTTIILLQKNNFNRYPIPYFLWKNKDEYEKFKAFPSTEENDSPWVIKNDKSAENSQLLKEIPKHNLKGRSGIDTGAGNGIFWIYIIKESKNYSLIKNAIEFTTNEKIEQFSMMVENDLIFPLLRGRDVSKWNAQPTLHIILPHTLETGMRSIKENILQECYPKTYSYLTKFRDILGTRRIVTNMWGGKAASNWYSIFKIGQYTFAPYKIVWKEMKAKFFTAVCSSIDDKFLGKKVIIPDHKLMLIPFSDEMEAHYYCAWLNSNIISESVNSQSLATSTSTKLIENIPIPAYRKSDSMCKHLSKLSLKAHSLSQSENNKEIESIENQIEKVIKDIHNKRKLY